MFAGSRDAHAVHKEVDALLRRNERQIRVFIDHGQGITRIIRGHGSFAALHFIEDLIHNIGLHYRFLSLQFLHYVVYFFHAGRVQRKAHLFSCNSVSIAGVIEHQHITGVLHIPQVCPGCGRFFHHGGVINNAGGAPGIRHTVSVIRVIAPAEVILADVGHIGDVIVIQLGQHVFGNHFAHHVVRRHDHIITGAAGFHFGIQALVGVKGGIVDLDTGQVLEGRNHVHAVIGTIRDIQAPVIHVQGQMVVGKAGPIVIGRNRDILVDLQHLPFRCISRQGAGKA